LGSTQLPRASDVRLRASFVLISTTETSAPGRTPPVESCTTPRSVPLNCCARAGATSAASRTTRLPASSLDA
jgi:hypothetical protein